jgi:hypothetical protein
MPATRRGAPVSDGSEIDNRDGELPVGEGAADGDDRR